MAHNIYRSDMSNSSAVSNMSNSSQNRNGPSSNQYTPPRIAYFITRDTGALVPLIPVDELPDNIHLTGVPQQLGYDQTVGMIHAAHAPPATSRYQLENELSVQRSTSQSLEVRPQMHQSNVSYRQQASQNFRQLLGASETQIVPRGSGSSTPRQRSVAPYASPWRRPGSESQIQQVAQNPQNPQNIIDAILSSNAGAETAQRIGYSNKGPLKGPSGNTPNPDKKEFCTYWIRTGECDYQQQGCLYKHEMPDKPTLEKIGFREVPRWWQERNRKVNLGSGHATVGPVLKPSQWLNHEEANGADSDNDDDDDNKTVTGDDDRSEPRAKAVMKNPGQTAKKPEVSETEYTAPHASNARQQPGENRPADAVHAASRATSVTLTPISTSANVGKNLTSSSLAQDTAAPMIPANREAQAPATPNRVFVPAGEDVITHMAESKNMASRRGGRQRVVKAQPMKAPNVASQPPQNRGRKGEEPTPNKPDSGLSTNVIAKTG